MPSEDRESGHCVRRKVTPMSEAAEKWCYTHYPYPLDVPFLEIACKAFDAGAQHGAAERDEQWRSALETAIGLGIELESIEAAIRSVEIALELQKQAGAAEKEAELRQRIIELEESLRSLSDEASNVVGLDPDSNLACLERRTAIARALLLPESIE